MGMLTVVNGDEIDILLDRIVTLCEDAIDTRGEELSNRVEVVMQYLERIGGLNEALRNEKKDHADQDREART
jgi:hypothetical protein